jgi:broad-specificity NMP kinase
VSIITGGPGTGKTLVQERQYGKPADETQQKHRAAALENLNRVIIDYRKRFQSYRADSAEQYAAAIGQVLHNVLIAWTQHRQCYVEIKKED